MDKDDGLKFVELYKYATTVYAKQALILKLQHSPKKNA